MVFEFDEAWEWATLTGASEPKAAIAATETEQGNGGELYAEVMVDRRNGAGSWRMRITRAAQ